MRPRRFLPSVKLLLAFEAVVRRGSVTAAASDLNLTQSTVSRLIQSLEEQLGQELFLRQNKRLVPTPAALAYQQDVTRALDIVQRASMAVLANPDGGSLSLAVLPTFATRWLGPRLGHFLQSHPGVSVNLSTRLQGTDFASEAFDAAIYFGAGDWQGLHQLKLFDERVTACASPEFCAAHPVSTPQDMESLPKLLLETRPTAWEDWFSAQGGGVSDGAGMVVDQFSMMIQAAISGLGVALLPDYLARAEIAEGRLQPILRPGVPVRGAYWLVWPQDRGAGSAFRAFRIWFAQQAALEG